MGLSRICIVVNYQWVVGVSRDQYLIFTYKEKIMKVTIQNRYFLTQCINNNNDKLCSYNVFKFFIYSKLQFKLTNRKLIYFIVKKSC